MAASGILDPVAANAVLAAFAGRGDAKSAMQWLQGMAPQPFFWGKRWVCLGWCLWKLMKIVYLVSCVEILRDLTVLEALWDEIWPDKNTSPQSFHFISRLAPCVPVMAPRRQVLSNLQIVWWKKCVRTVTSKNIPKSRWNSKQWPKLCFK